MAGRISSFAPLAAGFFAFQSSAYRQSFYETQRTHSEAKTVPVQSIYW